MNQSRRLFLQRAAAFGAVAPVAELARTGERQATGPVVPPTQAGQTVFAFAGDFFLTQPLPERLEASTEQVYDTMRRADLAFANLENGLSTVGSPELGGYRWGGALRGHPSLVKELSRAGIDVVSTANNHTGNFGRDAILESLATLRSAGVHHAGAGATIEEAFQPTHVRVNGLNVAFFSLYSCHYNRVSQEVATDRLPGVAVVRAYDVLIEVPGNFEERNIRPNIFPLRVNPAVSVMAPLREDVLRLSEAIRRGRGTADLAVLSVHFHWARHTRPDVPYHQRVIAHAAIDAGIDVFVGHGPHTLRGVELYRGKPVLFSLGNFVLQPQARGPAPAERDLGHQSVVARLIVQDKKPTRLEFLPIVMAADGQPRFVQDDTGRTILDRVGALSAEFSTEIETPDWYGTVNLSAVSA